MKEKCKHDWVRNYNSPYLQDECRKCHKVKRVEESLYAWAKRMDSYSYFPR